MLMMTTESLAVLIIDMTYPIISI